MSHINLVQHLLRVFVGAMILALSTAANISAQELENEWAIVPVAHELEDRHDHTERPSVQLPQYPAPSTPENVDTYRRFLEWQHATDDWFGWRPRLDDGGITIDASLTLDSSRGFRGGLDTGSGIFRHLFDLNATLDTDRLFGWNGGSFFIDFQTINGANGALLIGTAQGFSNIDADNRTQLPQLWFQQKLLDDYLRFKVGKVDANSEFATVKWATEFLNPSMGFSPTIFVMPSYPDPAASLNLFWHPSDNWYMGAGVYDGAGQRGVPTGSRFPGNLLDGSPTVFVIGEVGCQWSCADCGLLPGRAAAGAWHHNGQFDRFCGGMQNGTAGVYAVFEQQLFRENPCEEEDEQGLGAFLQYGYADPSVSPFEHHIGAGIAWRGAIPRRDRDSMGIGVSWGRFSGEPGAGFDFRSETAIEAFYKLSLTPWANFTADLQHIRHPGGVRGRRDALVGTMRIILNF